MEYRSLGKAGVRLSVIGLGSYLTIGNKLTDETARDTIRRAYDLGVNFYDTADAYNRGEAEKALGRCLADFPRSGLVIATKAWAPMGPGPNDRGLSAKHLAEACNASLERLGVDYVDLYQCHRPDAATPIEEVVRAMEDLARAGKILYWGVSEWPAWLIAEANGVAKRAGARPIVSNQPRYSLLYRQPEAELLPYCRRAGIGNVVFSPLAHGLLTGKYTDRDAPPAGTRAADPDTNMVIKKLYWTDECIRKSQELKALSAEMGVTAAQLSLAWTLRNKEVTSAIIGATKTTQVEENVKAADIRIPDDVLAKLDELFPGPAETYPLM